MHIEGTNKRSWKLVRRNGIIQSGYKGNAIPRKFDHDARKYVVLEHEMIDNVFFYTGIRATSWSRGQSSALIRFDDWIDEHEYTASVAAMAHLLFALQNGDAVVTEDGYITGYWTFRKMGSNISIWPCKYDNGEIEEYVKEL